MFLGLYNFFRSVYYYFFPNPFSQTFLAILKMSSCAWASVISEARRCWVRWSVKSFLCHISVNDSNNTVNQDQPALFPRTEMERQPCVSMSLWVFKSTWNDRLVYEATCVGTKQPNSDTSRSNMEKTKQNKTITLGHPAVLHANVTYNAKCHWIKLYYFLSHSK